MSLTTTKLGLSGSGTILASAITTILATKELVYAQGSPDAVTETGGLVDYKISPEMLIPIRNTYKGVEDMVVDVKWKSDEPRAKKAHHHNSSQGITKKKYKAKKRASNQSRRNNR